MKVLERGVVREQLLLYEVFLYKKTAKVDRVVKEFETERRPLYPVPPQDHVAFRRRGGHVHETVAPAWPKFAKVDEVTENRDAVGRRVD